MLYLIMFFIAFVTVFTRGLQTQNVVGGQYLAAFLNSWIMSALQIGGTLFIVERGWSMLLPLALGASIGVVCSMYYYRRRYAKETDKSTSNAA